MHGMHSCKATGADARVVEFGYVLQDLSVQFLTNMPLNQSFFMMAPNATRAAYYKNVEGMTVQSKLGLNTTLSVGTTLPGFRPPNCQYKLPKPSNGTALVKELFYLQRDIAGAFLGLAGSTSSPRVAFLMSRLALGHGSATIYFAENLKHIVFKNTTQSEFPAYPPYWVIKNGTSPGMLGKYLHGCAKPPPPPCPTSSVLVPGPTSARYLPLTKATRVASSYIASQTLP